MKKDFSIQVARVIAMFFIIICHVFQSFDSTIFRMFAQFFNVGVFIFLFLSGYLYGNKEIINKRKWFIKRYLRINLPVLIFIVFLSFFNFLGIKKVLINILIYSTFSQYIFGSVKGASHLWFISVIMICYIITLLISKLSFKGLKNIIICLLFIGCLSAFINSKISMLFFYILTFVIGYEVKKCNYIIPMNISFVGIIFSFFIRLIGYYFFDNTIFYSIIIFSFSELLFALFFYMIINYFCSSNSNNYPVLNYFDKLSYYIYITHYMFFVGPFYITLFGYNSILNLLTILFFSYVSAVLLSYIEKYLLIICKKIGGLLWI